MQQLNDFLYTVGAGETVTVRVEAVKVGSFNSYVVDAVPQNPVSNSPRTYRFAVTQPPGANIHSALSFFFPDEAPDDAEYRVSVSGDQGGGAFNVAVVQKSDGVDGFNISFRVV